MVCRPNEATACPLKSKVDALGSGPVHSSAAPGGEPGDRIALYLKRPGGSATWGLCVANGGYAASLEPLKVYRLLRATAGTPGSLVRVVDESGEGYLFPRSLFLPLVPKASATSCDSEAAARRHSGGSSWARVTRKERSSGGADRTSKGGGILK